jgi:ribosome-associated translation inhibitor RaiA
MEVTISAPGMDLTGDDRDRIAKSLEKIDRRLKDYDLVYGEVRISGNDNAAPVRKVTLEIDYGRHHLVAKAEHGDAGQALRQARDEIIRQINDGKARGGHSDYAKR